LRTYLHEFGHALGLWHEQSRNDRETRITVLYDNIVSDYTDQYDKSSGDGAGYGTYDYGSVMHYAVYNGVSKMSNGKQLPTFTVNNSFDPASEVTDASQIGRRDALSGGDLKALSYLYGNIAPTITRVKPTSSTVQIEISNPLSFDMEANAADVEDGSACCKVTWYAWKEGLIGTTTGPNSKASFTFKTLGPQNITATAEDSKGATDSLTFAVNVVHAAPQAEIAQPTTNQTVYRNLPFQLVANTGFAGNSFLTLTCTWSIPGVTPSPKGCNSSVLLGNNFPKGASTISLNVTDQYGGSTTKTVSVNVDELATLGVSIITPANNGSGSVNAGDTITLEKAVINGVAPISRVWTWQPSKQGCAVQTVTVQPAIVIQPGTSPDGYWDLTPQVNILPSGCGWGDGTLTVTVTDKNNQTASASVNFRVEYAPPPN
jgi:Astacin (Peptidase family M12A)